jgi:voltage-gated potassium channel
MKDNWQKATEWPLTISALAFLAAHAIPIINPDIPSRLERACEVIVWATWVLLGLDLSSVLCFIGRATSCGTGLTC